MNKNIKYIGIKKSFGNACQTFRNIKIKKGNLTGNSSCRLLFVYKKQVETLFLKTNNNKNTKTKRKIKKLIKKLFLKFNSESFHKWILKTKALNGNVAIFHNSDGLKVRETSEKLELLKKIEFLKNYI